MELEKVPQVPAGAFRAYSAIYIFKFGFCKTHKQRARVQTLLRLARVDTLLILARVVTLPMFALVETLLRLATPMATDHSISDTIPSSGSAMIVVWLVQW